MVTARVKYKVFCCQCGKSFHPTYSSAIRAKNNYCSKTCSADARRTFHPFRGGGLAFKVNKNGCHVFQGRKDKDGYGVLRFWSRSVLAHRLSYAMHFGGIPDGKFVLHKCDNPPCINPDHLEAGDQEKNMRDMVSRKRIRCRRGESCGSARLTKSDVLCIRSSQEPPLKLAALFGVTRGHIYSIRNGHSWAYGPWPNLNQGNKDAEK